MPVDRGGPGMAYPAHGSPDGDRGDMAYMPVTCRIPALPTRTIMYRFQQLHDRAAIRHVARVLQSARTSNRRTAIPVRREFRHKGARRA